ncbi:MAG: hypothetical protein IRY94_13795, partial [Rhodospirillaceae bacterium]|nr:hypothetical protein [Rhodospirillaceae bacterium]
MTASPAETLSALEALRGLGPALEAAGAAVWTLDLATDRAAALGALPGAPAAGAAAAGVVHLEDRPRFEAARAALAADGRPRQVEFRLVLPDGSV